MSEPECQRSRVVVVVAAGEGEVDHHRPKKEAAEAAEEEGEEGEEDSPYLGSGLRLLAHSSSQMKTLVY